MASIASLLRPQRKILNEPCPISSKSCSPLNLLLSAPKSKCVCVCEREFKIPPVSKSACTMLVSPRRKLAVWAEFTNRAAQGEEETIAREQLTVRNGSHFEQLIVTLAFPCRKARVKQYGGYRLLSEM